jgi:hypothetical protein
MLLANAPPQDLKVTMDAFVHAPPRWSTLLERQATIEQWIVFSRRLVDQPPEDAIGEWLERHHPPLVCETTSSAPCLSPSTLPDEASARLARFYQGFRTGLWISAREPQELTLRGVPSAALAEALCWLGCAELRWSADATSSTLLLRLPDTETMIFLPLDQAPTVADAGGTTIAIDPAVPSSQVWSARALWWDAGRPAQTLGGIEETLDRLESLGYISR